MYPKAGKNPEKRDSVPKLSQTEKLVICWYLFGTNVVIEE